MNGNRAHWTQSMYLALGVNLEDQKELLGLWLAETITGTAWCSTTELFTGSIFGNNEVRNISSAVM